MLLDDAPAGRTPLALPGLDAGSHRLEVRGAGLPRPWVATLELTPGQTATLNVDGEPRPVEDGWVRGLAPGPHEVAASQEGYQVWSTRVVLQPGHPARVEAELAQVATGDGPAWWAITTSVVAVGVLAGATVLATGAVGDGDVVPAAGLGTLGVAAAVLAVQAWLDRPATALPAEEELELPGG